MNENENLLHQEGANSEVASSEIKHEKRKIKQFGKLFESKLSWFSNCIDDPIVNFHNSELLDSALTANNITHRYIQYKIGGHGFGVSDTKGSKESRNWKYEFLNWLNQLFSKWYVS